MKTVWIAMAMAAGPALAVGPIQLPPLKEEKLENGLTTVVAQRRELPMVSVRLVLRAGSARDPRGKEGLAALVASLLRRGTQKRSADQIDDAVESIGGRLSVDAGPDATVIALSAPSERLGELLDVAADLATRPAFPQAEVDSARERTLAGLQRALDEPAEVADRALSIAAWGDHPYGHPSEGWTRTVKALEREDVVAFHKQSYVPRGAVLVVVGDVDPASVLETARKAFGAWTAPGGEPPALPAEPPLAAKVTLVDKPDATQSQVRIVFPGVTRRDPKYYAVTVGTGVLGAGFTSRLVEEVRVNRGLTYSIRMGNSALAAAGRVAVSTFTKTETTREIVDVTRKLIDDFAANGPTAKELDKTRRYMTGLYPLGLETDDDLARAIADAHLYGVGYEFIEKYPERLVAVERTEVGRVAREQLSGKPAIVVVGKAKDVRAQLEGLGEIQVVPLSAVE